MYIGTCACGFPYEDNNEHRPVKQDWLKILTLQYIHTCGFSVPTYSAFVRFLPSVPPHVNHQHILSLEWLLLTTTLAPATHKRLLIGLDMVLVYMLEEQKAMYLLFTYLLDLKWCYQK